MLGFWSTTELADAAVALVHAVLDGTTAAAFASDAPHLLAFASRLLSIGGVRLARAEATGAQTVTLQLPLDLKAIARLYSAVNLGARRRRTPRPRGRSEGA